jgi:hypothetical protein
MIKNQKQQKNTKIVVKLSKQKCINFNLKTDDKGACNWPYLLGNRYLRPLFRRQNE